MLPTIADRLGAGSADIEAIAARVGERRTHVVCDNVEHLLPDAARPLGELTAATPGLRLLTTSREPLRIQGESQLDLPPLAELEATALFMERAHAVRPDLVLDEHVTELCARLDHLPLAVELAAARTKLLSPEALLGRLDARLDLFKGTRDATERQSTLRATIAWSHDLLDEDEQRLFRRLAVFRGGCTLETAEAVFDADLDTLASLLDKNLIRKRTGTLGEERFWMLETIREFALERLEKFGEANEIRRSHALHMLEVARSAHLSEDDYPADVSAGLAERDNLRAALDWAEEHDATLGLELAIELQHLWNAAGPDEGRQRFSRLLDLAPSISPELRAAALRAYSGTVDLSGQYEEAERLCEESLAVYRVLGDDRGVASVEHMLAVSAWRREDWERMRELTEHSLMLSRGRFPFIETTGLYLLGELARVDGDLERATTLTSESAKLAHDAGWTWWESGQLHALLMLALDRGDLEEADAKGVAALRLERAQENRLWALYTIAGLAQVAHATGDCHRAGILWGAAEREAERLPRWIDERARRGGALVDETDPMFASAFERGLEHDLWDAVAFALDEDDQTEP